VRGHDVVVLRVLDPAEVEFPFTTPAMFHDVESGREIYIDPTAARPEYLSRFSAHAAEIERFVADTFPQTRPGRIGVAPFFADGAEKIAILAEAALSYLGLGTQPPQPSWGRMLSEAQTMMFQAPLLAVFPGLAIAFAVLGLNLLGDGLRDLLDPRLARAR